MLKSIEVRAYVLRVVFSASLACVLNVEADAIQKNTATKQSLKKLTVKTQTVASKLKAQQVKGTLVVSLQAETGGGPRVERLAVSNKGSKTTQSTKKQSPKVQASKPSKKWVEIKKVPANKNASSTSAKAAISYSGSPKKAILKGKIKQIAAKKSEEVTQPPRIMQARITKELGSDLNPSHLEKAGNVIKTAYNYLKTAYRMGGSSPRGFDCSGFTRFIFAKHGIELPRSSVEQAQRGKAINKEELRTGDLVFFSTFRRGISHVGIFIANGLFIHSAGRGKGVSLDNMLAGYWQQRYRSARRVDLSSARQYAMLDSEVLAHAG